MDTGDDHASVQQHDRVQQHGRAFVFGGRGTRTDAAAVPAGRHTAVPVGRSAARGRAVTGHRTAGVRGRRGRAAAERGRGAATAAAPAIRLAATAQQQREQPGGEVRRDDTVDGRHRCGRRFRSNRSDERTVGLRCERPYIGRSRQPRRGTTSLGSRY